MPASQQEIPGTEAPRCKAIEKAAQTYIEARDSRMKLTKKEVEAKKKLIEVCHENENAMSPHPDEEGVMLYKYGDEVVELTKREDKVKVRAAAEESEEEE